MKIEKFKVLLYLKKSGLDKNGKAPIMGRITVNRTMAQFSCKLSCSPSLWNPRASRLEGKSKEAVETNKDIYRLTDLAFGQLTEPFISDFHHYLLDEKGFSSGTITICKLAETSKTYSYHSGSHSKFFYLLNISELSILKNVPANDLETSYILFLSQPCNIQRTL